MRPSRRPQHTEYTNGRAHVNCGVRSATLGASSAPGAKRAHSPFAVPVRGDGAIAGFSSAAFTTCPGAGAATPLPGSIVGAAGCAAGAAGAAVAAGAHSGT